MNESIWKLFYLTISYDGMSTTTKFNMDLLPVDLFIYLFGVLHQGSVL